ncbi:MAG: protein kinase [Phycisphaerales bacterium]
MHGPLDHPSGESTPSSGPDLDQALNPKPGPDPNPYPNPGPQSAPHPSPIPHTDVDRDFGFAGDTWATAAARALRPEAPLGMLGMYRLAAEIGRGAQGVVYKALQPGTGRTVALKRLGAGLPADERDLEHLRREVRAATRLNHPNIVTVYSTESLGTHTVLVMEYVDGVGIDRWSDEARAENAAGWVHRVLRTFMAVCDGVSHAHQRGVIHRDIKPSNILVTRDGTPKVLDFGIALLVDHLRLPTAVTGFVGTPAYAAPEQVLGTRERDDTRCDVYALGAVLRRMVSGEELFGPDATLAQIVDVARTGTRTRPSRVNPALPPALDWIILKAMATEAAERYQSVSALAEDTARFLDGRAITAHPPTLRYLAACFVARQKAACALAATAIFAVLALSATSTMQAIRLAHRGDELAEALASEWAATAAADTARVRAQEQEKVASAERDRQRAIAAYLLDVAGNVADNSSGRTSVPVADLADWFEGADGALQAVDDPVVRARLHLGLSEMRRASDDVSRARWHAQQALLLLPASGAENLRLQALVRLCANTNSRVPDGEVAIAYMKQSGLADDPLAVTAWRQMATCYMRARRTEEAIAALDAADAVAERSGLSQEVVAQVASDRATVLWRGGRVEDAIFTGTHALEAIPPDDLARSEAARRVSVTLGEIAFAQGRFANAEESFARAEKWARKSPGDDHIGTRNVMRWHARALQELGRYDEAAALYDRLLQLVPPGHETSDVGVWWVRFRYGATLLGLGQTQEARRQLTAAVSKGKHRGPPPTDSELGAQVDQAERALWATRLRFTPELQKELGDLAWLVDFAGGRLVQAPGPEAEDR